MQDTRTGLTPRPNAWQALAARLEALGLSWTLLACIVLLALTPLFVKNAYVLRLLVTSLYFGTLAMAFDFTGGFINAVNFGFAGFVGLGAYVSALLVLNTGASPWLGLLAAMVVAGLAGCLTGMLTLPLRGIYVSLMSWFTGMSLMALASAWIPVTRGARGLIVPPLFESITIVWHLYLLLSILVVLYVALRLIIRSRLGLAFRAIGQNFDVARASGVNPTKYKLMNFTLSCACAGLLGGYYAHLIGIVTPDLLDTGHTLEVMALAYLGGSGSLLGGVFAAFLLIPLFDSLKQLMEYRLIIYGLSLILVMIFYPAGLNGLYLQVKFALQNRRRKPAG
jgi:branched-chain amino acid transport system permease protein